MDTRNVQTQNVDARHAKGSGVRSRVVQHRPTFAVCSITFVSRLWDFHSFRAAVEKYHQISAKAGNAKLVRVADIDQRARSETPTLIS